MKENVKDKVIEYSVDIVKEIIIDVIKSRFFPSKKTKEKIIYQTIPSNPVSKVSKSRKIMNFVKKIIIFLILKEFVFNRIKAKFFKIKDNRDYSWLMEYPVSFADLESCFETIPKDSVVIDLGSGTGYFSVKMAKHLNEKGKLIAVDINKKALNQLQQLSGENKVSNIELHRADIQKLPFPRDYVDFVFLNMTYGQIINKPKGIHEISRIMNDDAKLYITETMVDPFYSFERTITNELKRAGFKKIEKIGNFLNYILVFEKK